MGTLKEESPTNINKGKIQRQIKKALKNLNKDIAITFICGLLIGGFVGPYVVTPSFKTLLRVLNIIKKSPVKKDRDIDSLKKDCPEFSPVQLYIKKP